jgi:hypothetical protein
MPDATEFATRLLNPSLAPQAFAPEGTVLGDRATTSWHGSAEALRKVGLRPGTAIRVRDLAAVLTGRHTRTGAAVLPDGEAFELVFTAPNSLSFVWSQLPFTQRVELEDAMLASSAAMVNHLVLDYPVVGGFQPARSGVAALVLHAVGTVSDADGTIPPILHVHCGLFAVLDPTGELVRPDEKTLYDEETLGECDLSAEAELAQLVTDLGYPLRNTGDNADHSFELAGVPATLLDDADFWRNTGCAVVSD